MGLCPVMGPAVSPVRPHDAQGLPVSARDEPSLIPGYRDPLVARFFQWTQVLPASTGKSGQAARDRPGYLHVTVSSRDRGCPIRRSPVPMGGGVGGGGGAEGGNKRVRTYLLQQGVHALYF